MKMNILKRIIGTSVPIILVISIIFTSFACVTHPDGGEESASESASESREESREIPEPESGSLGDMTGEPEVELSATTLLEDTKVLRPAGIKSFIFKAEHNDGLPEDLVVYPDGTVSKAFDLMMPCRVDLSRVIFYAESLLGEIKGPYLADFADNEISDNEKYYVTPVNRLIRMTQSELPSLMVNTDDKYGSFEDVLGSEDHSVFAYGDMFITVTDELAAENGWMTYYASAENDGASYGTMSIRGRGNATWRDFDKKPFRIKTEKSQGLLGMGAAKKWGLLANSLDASFLRNQIFYNLALDIGLEYSVECRQVDLFVNGEYLGLYLLTELPEINENRIEIDEITDFLLEIDHYYYKETHTFRTKRGGLNITVHTPDAKGGVAAIEAKLNEIEEAIYDTESDRVFEMLDLESFARYYLLQELALNYDVLHGSGYMYYAGGKLYIGPVWDMDNTLAVYDSGPHMYTDRVYAAQKSWFKILLHNETFAKEVIRQYFECGVREKFLALPDKCAVYAEAIEVSAKADHSINEIYRHHNSPGNTWEADVDYVMARLEERLAWMERFMEAYRQGNGSFSVINYYSVPR